MRMMFLVFVGLSFTGFDYAQSNKQPVVRQVDHDGPSDSYGFYDLVSKVGSQSATLDDLDELGAFLDAKGLWIAPSSLAGSRILGNDAIVNFSQNAYETEAVLTDGIWFNPNDHDVFIDDVILQESFKLPSLGVFIVGGSFDFTDVLSRITMVKGAARDGREFQDPTQDTHQFRPTRPIVLSRTSYPGHPPIPSCPLPRMPPTQDTHQFRHEWPSRYR